MSWVITAITLTAASTATSIYGQQEAAKAQEDQLKEQAKQEKLQAESEKLARFEELNNALAANIVSQGTSGIAAEGTPAQLALNNQKKISLSENISEVNQRLRAAALKRAGKNARRSGNIGSFGSLLGGAASIASLGVNGGFGEKTTETPAGG